MNTRTNSALRWIAVLPAAVGAYFGVALLTVLQERVFAFPDVVCQFTSALFAPTAFVYAGTKTAPSKRLAVAISLTVFHAMLLAAATAVTVYQVSYGTYHSKDSLSLEYVRAAASIAATIGACVAISKSERTVPANRRAKVKLLEALKTCSGSIVGKYRRIAEEKGCAPSANTPDAKILEVLLRVDDGFQSVAHERGEQISPSVIQTITLFLLQIRERKGEAYMDEHLDYELEKYRCDGLREDYNLPFDLF